MVRGWIVKPLRSSSGERALAAAIVLQAVMDARKGVVEAAEWIEECGADWCDAIGMDGERLASWRNVDHTQHKRGAGQGAPRRFTAEERRARRLEAQRRCREKRKGRA